MADSTPAHQTCDQDVVDLRAALQRSISLLGYCAGREAVSDPTQSEMLLAAIEDAKRVLDRTARPERARG